MISSVVVVPAAPILLPEYAARAEAVPGLAGRCVSLVAGLAGSRVAVVYGSDRAPRSSKPPIGRRVAEILLASSTEVRPSAGVGTPIEGPSIEVRAKRASKSRHSNPETNAPSLAAPVWIEIDWDAPVSTCEHLGRDVAASDVNSLLVVADGSASRSEKAPGHLHPDAAAVDGRIARALRYPDAAGIQGLMELDPAQCAEVLAAGRAPLQVMAAALSASGSWQARSVEVLDPLGVLYIIARLTRSTDGRSAD